jgi:oxaloacetate decarboxylase alpha subunit
MNVVTGERYKVVPKETKDMFLGRYGKSTKPFDPEIQKKVIGDEVPITCRPADLIPDMLPEYEEKIAAYKQMDEDVLTYALFPEVAMDYFKYREAQQTGVDAKAADTDNKAYPV